MKKLLYIASIGIFVSTLAQIAIPSDTYASCQTGDPYTFSVNSIDYNSYSSFAEVGGTGANDTGVNWACGDAARGTMFFAQRPAYNYINDYSYRLNVNYFVDLGKSNNLSVMGLIHKPNNANSAQRVAFCITRSDCENGGVTSNPNPKAEPSISVSAPEITRVTWNNFTLTHGLTGWSAPESYTNVVIDGPAFKASYEAKRGKITYSNGYAILSIYNFRCYNSNNSSCGVSEMKLTVRQPSKVSTFNSQSGVKVDGYQTEYTWSPKDGTSTTKTVYVDNATVDVYFDHYIKREGDKDFAVSATLSVSGDGGGADSKKFDWNKNGDSGQYFNTSSKKRKKTVTATTSGVTVCDSASHPSSVSSFGETSGTSTSKACVKIIRRSSSCSAKENQGTLVVTNATNSQTWTGSTPSGSSDAGSIWAKPGDRINFKYDLCAGGQSAVDEYNKHPDQEKTSCKTTVNGLCTEWNYRDIIVNKDTNYNFSGTNSTATSANKGKYLFGTDSPFNTSTGTASWSAKNASDYAPVYYSPNTNNYKCPDSSSSTKYYQIPQVVASCKSAEKVGRDTDTGSIITQSLSWDYFKFNSRTDIKGNNTKKLTADVKIPYNYLISSKSKNTPAKPRYIPGNSYSVTYDVKPSPRINKQVSSTAYATETKPTTIRAYYFVIPPNVNNDNVDSHISSKFGGNHVKDQNGNYDGYYVSSITSSMKLTKISEQSNLVIDSDGYSMSINIPIDSTTKNLSLGAKLCVVTASSPADSHNSPTTATIDSTSQTNAFSTSGSGWKISEPTCYVSTKIPTFATVGASLYADGNVRTAIQTRQTDGSSTNYSFGSWTDYALNVRGNVEGFSSGATIYGGIVNANATACRLSPLTVSNKNCSSKKFGGAGIAVSNISSPKNVVDMIMSRYTQASVGDTVAPNGIANVAGSCSWDSSSQRYVRSGGSGYECLENGTKYIHSSGTIYVGKAEEGWYMLYGHGDDYSSRTVVIHSEQKVVIREGSVYGNSDASSVLDNHNVKYSKPSEFPQLLIIAPEIDIWGAVTNVDGWLIARGKDGNPGVINTCTDVNGSLFSYASKETAYYNYCNRKLTVNGPVYAQRINLLRSYGGGSSTTDASSTTDSNGSIKGTIATPAEYFNIPSTTYYWLFNQSERYQQASTTYQRELSPRY